MLARLELNPSGLRQAWQEGDRVELELPMPLRLEPVDAQHPNQVALLRGPLVLFAIAASQPAFEKAELLRAKSASIGAGEWTANAADGTNVVMRPFMKIQEGPFRAALIDPSIAAHRIRLPPTLLSCAADLGGQFVARSIDLMRSVRALQSQ